jgi:Flp pilus assembly protein TadG
MTRCPRQHEKYKRQRGSAMVEYALVLPIYLCLLLGSINGALVMYLWNCTAYAARAATRYASVHGSTATYTCTSTDLQNLVYNSVPGMRKATVTTTWTPNNSPGNTVTVNVKLTFSTFVPLIRSQSLAIASSSTMTILE